MKIVPCPHNNLNTYWDFLIGFQDGEKLGYETEAFAIYDVMRSLIFTNL